MAFTDREQASKVLLLCSVNRRSSSTVTPRTTIQETRCTHSSGGGDWKSKAAQKPPLTISLSVTLERIGITDMGCKLAGTSEGVTLERG